MRVLIAGASGFLGTALARRLEAAGHEVVRLGRRSRAGGPTWDPGDGRLDAGALDRVDAIVNLAGESIAGGWWTRARKQRIHDSRCLGTGLLAAAAARHRDTITVMISASAVGIYGDRGDDWLPESSPAGSGFLAEVGQAWEAATAPAAAAGIRVVLPRFGILLDPAGGMLQQLSTPFRLGLGAQLGDGRQWMSWLALDDAVSLLVRALEDPALAGPVNAVSPEPVRNRDFTAALARALHRPAPWRVPAGLLRLAMGQLADELLLGSQRCTPDRLVAAGFPYAHPSLVPALDAMFTRPAAGDPP